MIAVAELAESVMKLQDGNKVSVIQWVVQRRGEAYESKEWVIWIPTMSILSMAN